MSASQAPSSYAWRLEEPRRTIEVTEAKSRSTKGLELYAFGDGRWRLFTRIRGVHIMASGEAVGYSLFNNDEKRLANAQAAAVIAAEILEAAGAEGGF